MIATALVTGSGGLVGSETATYLMRRGWRVIGVDNDMRRYFFGDAASTRWSVEALAREFGAQRYTHYDADIRDAARLGEIVRQHARDLRAIVHTAAQPSHDWAAQEPITDFGINAVGTLNLLELARECCPETPFIFMSTNKVYGDTPNALPLADTGTRLELPADHPWFDGIDETMSIDGSLHSVFGASKVAADVLTQEYGRYFGMPTVCFRGGCLTGGRHSGAELHGFLAYLIKCAVTGAPYAIYGYGGKQVRDNLHSEDLVGMFMAFIEAPRCGEVYNAGGGRQGSCSVLEAIDLAGRLSGRHMNVRMVDQNRVGDHRWWISAQAKFRTHYPGWRQDYDLERTVRTIVEAMQRRWASA